MMTLIATAEGGSFNPLDLAAGGGFLWTLIIFVVALPFMWTVVMGPIARALVSRDEKASEAIVAAQKASADAEKARAEVEVALGEARAEAASLLADARGRAEARERELVDGARKEAEALLERARTEIASEQDKAIAAIRAEVVDLSLSAASRVLSRKVDAADDRRLVEELVGAVQSGRGGSA